ncbi:MAG: hypothetical protein WBF33_17075 [Candidatus Nitrosopolaris sp.]
MFHTYKTTMTFGTMAIAAVVLLFASGPIVRSQQVFAANMYGNDFCDPDPGISYPSPLSHFFGGDVLHHGDFHYYHQGGYHHHH